MTVCVVLCGKYMHQRLASTYATFFCIHIEDSFLCMHDRLFSMYTVVTHFYICMMNKYASTTRFLVWVVRLTGYFVARLGISFRPNVRDACARGHICFVSEFLCGSKCGHIGNSSHEACGARKVVCQYKMTLVLLNCASSSLQSQNKYVSM